MDQRLRGENLADRGGQRRPARLAADRLQLLQRLEQPVAGGVRPQVCVECGDEAGRQVVLGCSDREAWSVRRDDLVADVLVDEVGRFPEPIDVDAGGPCCAELLNCSDRNAAVARPKVVHHVC